ncbi:MAG: tRNA (adenosine(37)-N6)-threonylcarbamoyltransferase complex ATPase subunit type 1 TsaE [Bacteroidota bacterium]
MEWSTSKEEELPQLAAALLEQFNEHTVFVFQGAIGAGKTTFIKAICGHLGVPMEAVTSPTFAIVNEYSYQEQSTKQQSHIFHLDLYRLKTLEEALAIGIEDYLDGQHYCFVEWPELVNSLLPEDVVHVKIEALDHFNRRIIAE